MTQQNLWCIITIVLLFVYAAYYLVREAKHLRDESECRDIMESEVILLSKILSKNSSLDMIKIISKLHYFPDDSGSFFVMDYQGKLWCHSEHDHVGPTDLTQSHNLSFHLPHEDIIRVARQGGGYVRYEWHGRQKLTFVHPVANTPYIVGSGLCVDSDSQLRRRVWNVKQKLKPRSNE